MIAISTGGILVAACLLAAVLVPWWRQHRGGTGGGGKGHQHEGHSAGGRGWRPLAAPFLCFCIGVVCATSVGGAIGTVARKATQGTGQLGNDALHLLAGAQAQTATHAAPQQLSGGAALIILLALVVLGLAIRKAAKQRRRDLAFCLLAGLALGPAAFALQLAHGAILPLLTGGGNMITGNM